MIYNTESNKKILEFLKKNKDKSFSAEEIFSALSADGVCKSTVFRRLARLSESSEIKRLTNSADRSVRYQFMDREHCSAHLHLKCSACGRLIHLDNDFTHLIEERIRTLKSFSIDMSALIPGLCSGCETKGDNV